MSSQLKRQMVFVFSFLAYIIQAATADTYYRCRDDLTATPNAQFTITCRDSGSIINVQSALLGYSDRYDVLQISICPWTDKTSTTCQLAAPGASANCNSTFCSTTQCNCTRPTSEPASRCNGLNSCSFPQTITRVSTPPNFCVLSESANFVVVNYTCVQRPSESTVSSTTVAIHTTASWSTNSTHTWRNQSRALSTSIHSTLTLTTRPTTNYSSREVISTTPASRTTLSTGAIVGIAVGCTAFVVIIVLIIIIVVCVRSEICFNKSSKSSSNYHYKSNTNHNPVANGTHCQTHDYPDLSTNTYEQSAAFQGYGAFVDSQRVLQPQSNGEKKMAASGTAEVYTLVNKPKTSDEMPDGASAEPQQQVQGKKNKKKEKKKMQVKSPSGSDTAAEHTNGSVVSLYPTRDAKVHTVPIYTDAGSVEDVKVVSAMDSQRDLTVMENSVYAAGAVADDRVNDPQFSSAIDSQRDLTVMENSIYAN